MNLFASCPVEAGCSASPKKLFVVLFMVGVALRGYACFTTSGIICPDEHQQFLEQAFRKVHGYGQQFWEQQRGIRHPLYPAMLAVPLAVCSVLGVRDPIFEAAFLRFIVSLFAFASWSLLAWEFQRRGKRSISLMLMAVVTLSPDVIFLQIHPLSEVAATVPLLFAFVWLDRRPFWSGLLLTMAFAIRFQVGFLVAGIIVIAWLRNRCRFDRPFCLLASGFALGMAALGFSDWLMFGNWFHSPIEYFRANIVEGAANDYGVAPWYRYFVWLKDLGWFLVVPLAIFIFIGTIREWRMALVVLAFVVPHLMIGHKESRFMLPICPFVLALMVVGFDLIGGLFSTSVRRILWIIAFLGLIISIAVRYPQVPWQIEPYRSTAYLLRKAGTEEELSGIAVFHQHFSECPNYFFLRRQVPIVVQRESDLKKLQENLGTVRINYVICLQQDRSLLEQFDPVEIEVYREYALYRLRRPITARHFAAE